jgi:hypothetical protein
MWRAGVLVCAVACGAADAPPKGDDVVTLTTTTLDFIAYRDGSDGPWKTPIAGSGSDGPTYTLDVAGNDYVLVLVCDSGGSGPVDAEQYDLTVVDDGHAITASCAEPVVPSPPQLATITGTMVEPGSVADGFGNSVSSATGPWTYTLTDAVDDGELVAIDTTGRVVVATIAIGGAAVAGPTLDTGSGAALVLQQLFLAGLGSSALSVASFYDDVELGFGSAAIITMVPESLVGPDNIESMGIIATDAIGERGITASTYTGTPFASSYALLSDFTTATFQGTTASWSALPAPLYSDVEVLASSPDGSVAQNVTASWSWIAARGATSVSFDASAPGYLAAWSVDPATASISLQQQYNDWDAGAYYYSAIGAIADDPFVTRRRRRVR